MTTELALSPDLTNFGDLLRNAAAEADLYSEKRPELASSKFNGGSSKSTSLDPSDLPVECNAIRIDRFNIVLGVLPNIPTVEAVRETLRRYRNQCVVARSYLGTNETLDLHLMLLGPRSSENNESWRGLALMVERDDRVARKLAWLRPQDEQRDIESFYGFLKRTFLARPWVHDSGKFDDAALDELSGSGASTLDLPRKLAEDWERIALDEEKSSEEVVTALISAWERKEQA